MCIEIFSASSEYSIDPHAWVLIDVDVREFSFLCYCEILLTRVDSYRAYAIYVFSMENLLILSLNVVYLVGVSISENYNVFFQVAYIESLMRLEALAI